MNKKYLIGDKNGKLYTVDDNGTLEEISGYLSAALFSEYGIDEIPSSDLLKTLTNPSVYCWTDAGNPKLKAVVSAMPKPQIVITQDIDMSDKTIIGIESITIDGDDNTLYAVSADGGETWWNYVNFQWVQLSEDTSGQRKEDIESISTSAWSDFATTGQIRFRFVLSAASNYVREIKISYLNTKNGEPTQRILRSIGIKSPPNKQIYTLGEVFDLTGISIIADYDNNTRADVTNGCKYSINDGEMLIVAGIQAVKVSYTENGITRTESFEIDVQE